MKKAFVAGWPVAHSKSPAIHGYWLKKHQIDGTYEAIEVEPNNASSFLGSMTDNGFVGGNITIPHKEIAHDMIRRRDRAAEIIGAVNTIWLQDGELSASNTDAFGFAANLDEKAPEWRDAKTALVLGAGGASRAVIHALQEAGFNRINIVNRTEVRATNLANHFGTACKGHGLEKIASLLPDTEFFVNTSSLGMAGSSENTLPDISGIPRTSLVTDIVYTPLRTPFLETASSQGNKTVDGLGMLLHQAVPGFEKWFGVRPEVTDELRSHMLELL